MDSELESITRCRVRRASPTFTFTCTTAVDERVRFEPVHEVRKGKRHESGAHVRLASGGWRLASSGRLVPTATRVSTTQTHRTHRNAGWAGAPWRLACAQRSASGASAG